MRGTFYDTVGFKVVGITFGREVTEGEKEIFRKLAVISLPRESRSHELSSLYSGLRHLAEDGISGDISSMSEILKLLRTAQRQKLLPSFPTEEGAYLGVFTWGDYGSEDIVQIYEHPLRGLCCSSRYFKSRGEGIDPVPLETIKNTKVLEFLIKVGDLNHAMG